MRVHQESFRSGVLGELLRAGNVSGAAAEPRPAEAASDEAGGAVRALTTGWDTATHAGSDLGSAVRGWQLKF